MLEKLCPREVKAGIHRAARLTLSIQRPPARKHKVRSAALITPSPLLFEFATVERGVEARHQTTYCLSTTFWSDD